MEHSSMPFTEPRDRLSSAEMDSPSCRLTYSQGFLSQDPASKQPPIVAKEINLQSDLQAAALPSTFKQSKSVPFMDQLKLEQEQYENHLL
jgi:hypothetical protein